MQKKGRKGDTAAPTGDFALDHNEWNKVWLDSHDIQQMILTIVPEETKKFTSIPDNDIKYGDGQIAIHPNNKAPIPLFVIGENEDMHQFCTLNCPAIAIVCKNQNHWVAVKKELISGKHSTNSSSYNYHFADSFKQTSKDMITETLSDQALFSSILEDTIYGKVLKQLGFTKSNDRTKDFVEKNIFDWRDNGFPVQHDADNCGIHAALNAIDMALNNQGENVLCTQDNVAKYRKLFCGMKVEQAKQSEQEKFYTECTVGGKAWKVTTPSPLHKKGNSPLMELLTKHNLVEQDSKQKQFLFKENNSDETAYIDTKYNHAAVANNSYELQTTIDKHTKIITNGLIDAYKEVYGKNTVDFAKIQEIWKEAQDEGKWKQLRAKYQGGTATEEETNKLKFSARFQKIMEDNNLMTGNPNATNLVGMRLKRVSDYHMKALQAELETKSILGANLSSHGVSNLSPQVIPTVTVNDQNANKAEEIKKFLAQEISDKNPLQLGEAKCLGNMEALCIFFNNEENKIIYKKFLNNLHTNLEEESRNTYFGSTIDDSKTYGKCANDIKQSLALFQLFSPNEPIIQQLTTGWWSYIKIDAATIKAAKTAHDAHQTKKTKQNQAQI